MVVNDASDLRALLGATAEPERSDPGPASHASTVGRGCGEAPVRGQRLLTPLAVDRDRGARQGGIVWAPGGQGGMAQGPLGEASTSSPVTRSRGITWAGAPTVLWARSDGARVCHQSVDYLDVEVLSTGAD